MSIRETEFHMRPLLQMMPARPYARHYKGRDTDVYWAILDKLEDAIFLLDAEGNIRQVNTAIKTLFGYRDFEVLGQALNLLFPEFDLDEVARRTAGRRGLEDENGHRETHTLVGRRLDGSRFPARMSLSPLTGSLGGGPSSLICYARDISGEQRIEQALKESEQRFNEIAALACDWIWEQDACGRYTYCNPAVQETLGYEPAEVVGKHYEEFFAPEQRETMAAIFPDSVAIQGRFSRLINRYRHRDGHEVLTESSGEPVFDAGGRLIKWRGVDHDITARQRYQDALRESEETFRLTLAHAPIGIATLKPDGRFLSVNSSFCAMVGYGNDELSVRTLGDIIHPDDAPSVATYWQTLLRGESRKDVFETRYRRKDGSIRLAHLRAGLVCGLQGRHLLVVGEFEDVTERQRAAEELQRTRSYLQGLVDSMPSMLIGIDAAGCVTEWNLGAERITQVSASEALGRKLTDLLPELGTRLPEIQQAVNGQVGPRLEHLVTGQGSDTRYQDLMVFPLLADGPAGAALRIDDVTERVRMEQTMVQTEKMLSVGGLAAGMAHEINNPLSGILQSCQNIERRLSPDLPANRRVAESLEIDLETVHQYLKQRGIWDFIEGIQEAAQRASRIVADMLNFSRQSQAEFALNPADEMLETVLRIASSDYDLRKKYDFKQIEIVRDYDPALAPIYCDRHQIEQVFLNIIKNAAQAMAGAGIKPGRLTLRTRQDDHYARIEIADNGPGMDEDTRRRVFEPFFTTKAAGVGTGLGMSVSFFIITEQHHGEINVSSGPDEGSTFVIRLPLSRNAAQ